MDTGFSSYHPLTQFIYFTAVLSVCMFIMHPVFLGISFLSACVYIIYSEGSGVLFRMLRLMLITSAMIIIINPIISHRGITPLLKLPDGNMLTMEALIFGISAALMLSSITAWFFSINRIFTSDRVIWLFGRISPKLGLMLSMTLNFLSKFNARFRQVRAAHYPLKKNSSGGKKDSLRYSIRMLSIMIQWSLENSIDTVDSMKSRGYGTSKRSFYSVFRFRARDLIIFMLSVSVSAVIFIFHNSGAADYSYYPFFEIIIDSFTDIALMISYLLLCQIPLIIDIREDFHWKSIRSEI